MIEKFGNRIRQIRLNKSITMSSVAKKIGISSSYLNDIEASNRLPFRVDSEKMALLFKALELDCTATKKDLLDLAYKERTYLYHPEG